MSAIRRLRRSRATIHHPRHGGTGLWRNHSCSLRYSWLGQVLCACGSGSVAQLTASSLSTGHEKGQVWGRGSHVEDEAGDGRWEDGSCCLPRQVHSTPPHWGQVVGRACHVLAHVVGVGLDFVVVRRCQEWSSTMLCPELTVSALQVHLPHLRLHTLPLRLHRAHHALPLHQGVPGQVSTVHGMARG